MNLKLGSLFSGIGGFEYAGSLYGIDPVWASEIESSCIKITREHFPNMIHLGDITNIHGGKIEPVDIISGGSPCTDLSLAGNQTGINLVCADCGNVVSFKNSSNNICPECGGGLESTRSGLFMEQIRIIKEMRESTHEQFPKVVIWENVFGAFSSNNGDDFFTVLEEFCKLIGEKIPKFRPEKWEYAGEILADKGSITWRTLDAQYWGVPQRRRRIFLVIDFTGQRARTILFESDSLRRYTPQGKISWQRASRTSESSLGESNSSRCEIKPICVATQQVNAEMMIDKCPTLTSANGTSGSNKPYIVLPKSEAVVYGLTSYNSNSMKSDNPDSGIYETNVSKCLDTGGLNPCCNQGGNIVVENPVYCIQANCIDRADTASCNGRGWKEDVSYTLTTIDRPAVAYEVKQASENKPYTAGFTYEQGSTPNFPYKEDGTPPLICGQRMAVLIENHPADSRVSMSEDNICQTLSARMGTGGGNVPLVLEEADNNTYVVTDASHTQICANQSPTITARDYKDPHIISVPNTVVRRLTPLECERLQGFPDNWTASQSDSARYKALGNSVAVPCVAYIMSGIVDLLRG